jgi:hypothetical protein
MDLHPYILLTRSTVFAEPKCPDIQDISGPLSAAEVISLIFLDWPSFKIRRSLEFQNFQSTGSS